jgi:predicted amidohydrolase
MEFKVSVIQFMPRLGHPEANIEMLRPLLGMAKGSALVVLPELSNSGYHFRDRDEARLYAEEIGRKGIYQDFLVEQADLHGFHIVSGIDEKEGEVLYNSAILVGPGGVAGKYRKTHLFMDEKDIFKPGDGELPVFDLGGFKAGILICFDYLFPEPWRMMAQKGADIICHPSNLITENAHRCIPGLALMNRIYIATANRTGTERGLTFNGRSSMTRPDGQYLGMASSDRDEILTFALDTGLSRNKMAAPRNHVFGDRRPELYTL